MSRRPSDTFLSMVLHDKTSHSGPTSEHLNNENMDTAQGVTNFGIKAVRAGIPGAQNGILANTSITSVLGMTLLGAKGSTASQLKDSLTDSASDSQNEADNSMNTTQSTEGEDEVDGMVHVSWPPSTHMDTVDIVTTSSKEQESSPEIKMNSLKKMRKLLSFQSDDSVKWVCVDEHFHTSLGQVITFDAAMRSKKSQVVSKGYTLSSANRIYLKKNGSVAKGFLSASEKLYHSKPEVMNFAGNPEKCRHEINSWVEKQTNGRIKDLIAPGTISQETSILIVNAIYFKGEWANKFDPVLTRRAPFYTIDGQDAQVEFMYKNEEMLYREGPPELDCQVVELPYVGGDISFVAVIPNQTAGLLTLEQALNAGKLSQLTSGMYEKEVLLYLPKFKIEVSLDLADVLQGMGITDVFNPYKADLSGMDPKGNLHVSNIIHKAFIEVNEEGSEAAGATAEILMAAGAPRRRTVVKADHPFLFLIKDNRSGVTLFLGKYCYP